MNNVILDLDNTLISAEALTDFPFEQKGIKQKSLKFAIHDMDGYYIIFERPKVQKFLTWLFENFNVSVWTAASKDYALFIIKNIILQSPERKLDYILFSHHCDLSKNIYGNSKNLKLFFKTFKLDNYKKSNTIIIDDLDEVHYSQPDNCIHIKAFEILDKHSEYDKELDNIKTEITDKFYSLKNIG